MKNFTAYLLESEERTYEFKIKLADTEVTNEVQDNIEHALAAFNVDKISKAKRLPICNKSPDFPSRTNCEVSLITVSLKDPCNDAQVLQVLLTQGRLVPGTVKVEPNNQSAELENEDEAQDETDKKKEPILTKEIEKIEGGQLQVGQKRLENMLKELEKDRKDRKIKFEKEEKAESSNVKMPQNNTSPISGRKGK